MIATTLKQFAVKVSDTKAFAPVVRHLERRGQGKPLLRVLAYHRITEPQTDDPCHPGLISTSPTKFAAQMDVVARSHYVCTMAEVVAASNGDSKLPADSVLLTFDDATVDFARHAWPVLNARGLPATVFVPTAYPDNSEMHFWWDRLHRAVLLSQDRTRMPTPNGTVVTLTTARQRQRTFRVLKEYLKTIPHSQFQSLMATIVSAGGVADPAHNNVLSWDELRKLAAEGVTLAPHTHTHPMLNQLPDDDICHEVTTSLAVLREQIAQDVSQTLAYPAGGVSNAVISAMDAAGFDLAFSTQRGVNAQTFRAPFELRRINVGARTTLGLLRMQLANWGR
jgi:peptidoglycan/xylan/chitin deacetylase (PgdA/CDA1 family)